ncbi:hypothetical protein [Priestia megaterium]|uniref:hypothetical protein n=1 Tax=Priestia megaterium TaxID=1404 RepID=UPI000CA36C85|nr:hypothetical protein [Priestia megaterium]AUO14693.1 hypothetical protein C0569_25760 [Priestia megaterium]
MKTLSIVCLMSLATLFSLSTAPSTLAATSTSYQWRTSVDVPVDYSSKIKYLEQGVLLQGARPSKKEIHLQLIKKGFWADKVYDQITIKPLDGTNSTFKATLHAPAGNDYYIKIGGYALRSGTLIITPI